MHQNKKTKINTQTHIPVLLSQTVELLDPQKGESYLDLTAGYGGHASAMLERTQLPEEAVLVDRDQMAIETLQAKFGSSGVKILPKDFYSASQELADAGQQFNIILADLGVSSPHLNTASRGFAFMQTGPLDMRMDQSQALSAATIVNTYGVQELTDILRRYGEEPRASKIAQLIAGDRPVETTTQLATLVAKAYPGYSRTHPATRTFQAIRIAVNDELEMLRRSIPIWVKLLAPGGRLGVISFHSLEDRIIKNAFKELAGERYDAELRLVTKRPVVADKNESVFNPRSRSAKLRVVVKIKNKKERDEHANSG
jgi:16S rRNA (cytosine1402-N4)-methyltransferase